jgi:threonine synthase
MRYVSTRGRSAAVSFSEAMLTGLAPDGGLYVPESWPALDPARLDGAGSYARAAAVFLEPFLAGDRLAPELPAICERAFDFPVPLAPLDETTSVLELYHGPTAAFKDFGARFLAECFARLPDVGQAAAATPLTILVATSGDTGGAVAAAFHRKPGVRVAVLFPKGGVSPRQEHQLTCWGDNVHSFAVRGSFDDCQRLVKQAFQDPDWNRSARLTSANSINIGRLLPQAAYYAESSSRQRRLRGAPSGFVVPSGNLGNALGALWARRAGFPLTHVALACNANRTVPDWFATGEWKPRPPVSTLANAMDVGDPSNAERLRALYPLRADLLRDASAASVDDATIREVIASTWRKSGRVACPHTATALHLRARLATGQWVVVATAHAAKFDTIVEPLVGTRVQPPPALAELLSRPSRCVEIEPELRALRGGLD